MAILRVLKDMGVSIDQVPIPMYLPLWLRQKIQRTPPVSAEIKVRGESSEINAHEENNPEEENSDNDTIILSSDNDTEIENSDDTEREDSNDDSEEEIEEDFDVNNNNLSIIYYSH